MKIIDPVKTAAEKYSSPAEPISAQVPILRTRTDKLHLAHQALLPIEMGSRPEIEREYNTSKLDLGRAEKAAKVLDLFPKARLLDPEPLSWRHGNGLPVLAPFSPQSTDCIFDHEGCQSIRKLDESVYRDVAHKLTSPWTKTRCFVYAFICWLACLTAEAVLFPRFPWANVRLDQIAWISSIVFWVTTLAVIGASLQLHSLVRHRIATARFTGLIPPKSKEIIRRAEQSPLFREVFLLVEVEEWDIRKEPKKKSLAQQVWSFILEDPLIVGFDGESLWLLDSFDLTTTEALVYGSTSTPTPTPA
ncbi:MAG: hypothetical protein QOG91_554 [Candidatus Parcubacteria bacterium]|jgi:hypothetical protein|nr:hypothetical protein [Candidatus Parcubacteria bacterium]